METVRACLYGRRKNRSVANAVLNVLIALVIAALAAELVFGIFYQPYYVVRSSMLPTLTGAADDSAAGGDYVYVRINAAPTYGDIVVVNDGSKNIIKRAIAFGGDTVRIDGGQLYIRYAGAEAFVAVEESYLDPARNSPEAAVNTFGEHTVAEGCLFLLGDNRNDSSDSREHGDYSLGAVVGVVPSWSLKYKAAITAFHTFFCFTLPAALGLK